MVAALLKKPPPRHSMRTWNSQDKYRLAAIFGVPDDQVRFGVHPLPLERRSLTLAHISFVRGSDVAAAVASFLNREFYSPAPSLALSDLHYSANNCAFVNDKADLPELRLSLDDDPQDFLERLSTKQSDVRFVILHPEILPAMRSFGSFGRAKQSLLEPSH